MGVVNLRGVSGRFWSKVNRTPTCWIWTGALGGGGYGRVRQRRGPAVYAHRFSFELHNGAIPPGLLVLHRCDNPPCVRPEHLFLGTGRDNMRDMVGKGRNRQGRLLGAENPAAKLTERDVVVILGSPKSNVEVARLYGTTASLVGLIRSRRVWGHVKAPRAIWRDGRKGRRNADQGKAGREGGKA